MKVVLGTIGGILMFLGIHKFVGIYESYQILGPLLNNPWSQRMMDEQIGIAIALCVIGGITLVVCVGTGRKSQKKMDLLEEADLEKERLEELQKRRKEIRECGYERSKESENR